MLFSFSVETVMHILQCIYVVYAYHTTMQNLTEFYLYGCTILKQFELHARLNNDENSKK